MLWILIRKEALAHFLSARFQLTVALVIVLMAVGGVLFRGEYDRRLGDFNTAEAGRIAELAERSEQGSPLFQVFSYYDQQIMARPGVLGFIADGHEQELPNLIKLNAFRVNTPTNQQRGNPMLPFFDAIDWLLVVTVVLSFAAIVLTFDGFAGEKERGTLRLILANPVPRWMLVAAKLVGAWLVLMISFLVGAMLQLLIILPAGWLVLDSGTIARMILALTAIGIFVAIFVLLGLLVSTRQASAAGALMVGLLLWSLLVVVVPRSTVLCSRWLPEVATFDEADQQASAAWTKVHDDYLRLHPKKENAWISGHWSPQESLDLACQLWLAYDAEMERWWRRQVRQVELARRLSWISPAVLLHEGLERISGTGIVAYDRFLDSALRYRVALQQQVRSLYPLDTVNAPGIDPELMQRLQDVEVDPSQLPVFDHSQGSLGEVVTRLAVPGTLLMIVALLLFLAASVSAARYDVR